MSQGFYGFPHILDIVRATTFKVLGKAGATAGAALAGGTASGAPTTGQFDAGDAVIGQDGTLRICTVAGSPGTWVQLGTLVDPLTTRGDLIVRGASATTRLALGSTNQVLTSNGTDATWAVAPASAGGALTQIAQTTLGSSAASITFSSIPGTYSSLQVVFDGRSDASAVAWTLLAQFNGDTASNYDAQAVRGNISVAAAFQAVGSTSARVGTVPGSTATAGLSGSYAILLPNYAGTTFHKQAIGTGGFRTDATGTNYTADVQMGFWRSTAAITSVKLFPGSGNFITGTVVTVYGLS